MYRTALINMPFAAADFPSIALAQLKAMVRRELPGEATSEDFHPNLDFVTYLSPQFYEIISNTVPANTSGLGDWFFSHDAFPEKPDDPEAYLLRHFSEHRALLEAFRRHLSEKRQEVGEFLEGIIDSYGLDRYDLVGFTSMFCQNIASFALARRLKARRPDLVIVMGGANCEAPMGSVIAERVPWVDFVFSGPALRTFPRLVRHLARGEAEACHTMNGVLSRQKLAARKGERGREIGEDLDISVEVPLDYDNYFAAFDEKVAPLGHFRPKLPFETSRGCWWGERSHCTFCGLNGATMKYRAMPPAQAVTFLNSLFARYGERCREFQSVDNILPREYLTDVLPHLETPADVSLFYEIKADLKEHEVAALARARVTRIQPGIEAMASSTLKLMRKGITSFQNIRFLKHCQRYGIQAFWNLLVGFPNEPEEVYRKYCDDLPLLTHLEPPAGAFPVRFDRYSPYHTQAREYGLELRPCDFYEMIYPFPHEDFHDLAYFFVDRDYQAAYLLNTARWLGKLRERIAAWQARWEQRDGKLKPELILRERDGVPVVFDSRSGTAVEHVLTLLGARILATLETHLRAERVAERLEVPEAAVAAEITELRRRRLLFEEDSFYISLVILGERAAAGADLSGFLPEAREGVAGSSVSSRF
jgi:ribosomal peptide maturation radical SAM protein 1